MFKSLFFLMSMMMSFIIVSFPMIKKFNNPMSLGLSLFLFTFFSCLNIGLWKMHFIYSYILYISMISGLLILMLYFISILCNETTNLSYFMNMTFIMFPLIIYLFMNLNFDFFFITNFDMNKSNFINNQNFWLSMNYLYCWPMSSIFIFLMIYLLIFLYFNVKICMTNKVSLRQMKI